MWSTEVDDYRVGSVLDVPESPKDSNVGNRRGCNPRERGDTLDPGNCTADHFLDPVHPPDSLPDSLGGPTDVSGLNWEEHLFQRQKKESSWARCAAITTGR